MFKEKVQKALVLTVAIILALAAVAGCISDEEPALAPQEGEEKPAGKIIVGSKTSTEQLILGQKAILLLEDAGFEVLDKTGLGETSEVRKALETGEIDLCWEYTGTAWIVHLGNDEFPAGPLECFEKVREEDSAKNGMAWLDPTPFSNTYALLITGENAQIAGINTISDLAAMINEGRRPFGEWVLAAGYEYALNPDGYPGLSGLYEFEFDDLLIITDPVLIYEALRDGEVVVAVGTTTAPYLAPYDLQILEDDRSFHPFFNCAPVLRQEILEEYPEMAEILGRATLLLDEQTMSALNASVEFEGQDPRQAAQQWLESVGLLDPS